MKIVIIGCTNSTRRFIKEILKHKEFQIVAIFTLEDRFAHKKSRFVLLDDIALDNDIKLYKIADIKDPKIIEIIKNLEPDLILESGWSQIIPKEIINVPKKGCIGIHYSYLPKNQGAASLNWALIKNEKEWGVTLFYLTEKIDDGDIIDRRKFRVEEKDDINSLFKKADLLVEGMLKKNLSLIDYGKVLKIKQNKKEASYLPKRTPEDGRIDWKKSSLEIHNLVRAITKPYPGAFTFFRNKKLLIWKSVVKGKKEESPGKIIKIIEGQGIVVGTGMGKILLRRLQFEQGLEMEADKFARKNGLKISNYFD